MYVKDYFLWAKVKVKQNLVTFLLPFLLKKALRKRGFYYE